MTQYIEKRGIKMMNRSAFMAMASIAVAVALSAPANADPDIGAAGCVQAGNAQQFCADKFIASIESIPNINPPVDGPDRQEALNWGVFGVNELLHALTQGPDAARQRFDALIPQFMEQNPWADAAGAKGFILLAVHWFGPVNMEAAINQALK